MTALGEVGTITDVIPALGGKLLVWTYSTTVVSADTITVDLTDYGCTNIHGIIGWKETTAGSVVVQEQPTTEVSSGALTITVGGSAVTAVRSYLIWAY